MLWHIDSGETHSLGMPKYFGGFFDLVVKGSGGVIHVVPDI
jgi:hypothetical protein